MIRVRQVKLAVDDKKIKKSLAKKLKIKESDIKSFKINKQSIDARKDKIYYVYEVDLETEYENKLLKNNDVVLTPDEKYKYQITGLKKIPSRPVIIGSGPAGLFLGYFLALNNYQPIIIERGEDISKRVKTVNDFWENNNLNINSNVQFGLGGAGTFSDGKLNTQVKDKRIKEILRIFNLFGADENILYKYNPHIGTDVLRKVVNNMKNEIIKLGGEFYFNTCLNDLVIENNIIKKIKINDEYLECDNLFLAIGNSARDTFKMLNKYLKMEAKPFAVGLRIQHLQSLIDKRQYNNVLTKASYKLTYTTSKKRGVYSFCMCPGGYVVNASSENKKLVVNGMSNQARDTLNANSAIVVTVFPKDFKDDILSGMEFQRQIEAKAYEIGNGLIPVQLFKDYLNNTESKKFGSILPVMKGKYTFANLNQIFPNYINEALKEGILNFNKKINGFSRDDAILAGVEARTSSPIRILRDENYLSNIKGIYPLGEGSGYSGGITTSALDGLKVFEAFIKEYHS